MKVATHLPSALFPCADSESMRPPVGKLTLSLKLVMMVATVATLASLGIAIYVGWQSGGPLIERLIRVVLIGVAVLFVHWLPAGWSALRGFARFAACALWIIAIVVVLYGQAVFFMVSQQHAGDRRAATVSAPAELTSASLPLGRSRTVIAQDTAKIQTDLARSQAARCWGDCPKLKARRAGLAAELAALEVEANEAMRRQASEDRQLAQANRIEERRQRLRADPVASPVASWFGMTEHRVELLIGLAHAVVLEGAAIMGWLLLSVAPGRAARVSDKGSARLDPICSRETVAARRETEAPERGGRASDPTAISGESTGSPAPYDELSLKKIHEAVTLGQLKPTQDAIRKLLRCGQRKAGGLNREYCARFGSRNSQRDEASTSAIAIPVVADG